LIERRGVGGGKHQLKARPKDSQFGLTRKDYQAGEKKKRV